jgi:hypothetical protein
MSQKQQVTKNLDLSEKLADYLAQNPSESSKLPKKASFVTFSAKDKELNEKNEEIVTKLTQQGQTVIKAQETTNDTKPWVLSKVASL